MIVVIPAYEPDEKLINLVHELQAETDYKIIVVNDGSNGLKLSIFDRLPHDVTVLHHEVNKGKGRAMKTAFEWIEAQNFANDGIITVDADGQHIVKDIMNISNVWSDNRDALVLGSRRFSGKVPFKSRFGNGITRAVFAITTGVRVYDTQTGLRAFSTERIHDMLQIKGERYEYEINQLLLCTRLHIPIIEETIETVYINENETSHFHALRDSWRIYKTIFSFISTSVLCWLIDYFLLLLLAWFFDAITNGAGFMIFGVIVNPRLPALIIARVTSSLTNYFMNKRLVFSSQSKGSMLKYILLAASLLVLNYLILAVLNRFMSLWLAQLIAQCVQLALYPVNFVIQRKFVFIQKGEKNEIQNK